MNLNKYESLDECIENKMIVRRSNDYSISNQYWKWCSDNAKPFVAIPYTRKNVKYVRVEIDLYNTTYEGFNKQTIEKIGAFFKEQDIPKRGTHVCVYGYGPVYSQVLVNKNDALKVAAFLYNLAIDENVCISNAIMRQQIIKQHS